MTRRELPEPSSGSSWPRLCGLGQSAALSGRGRAGFTEPRRSPSKVTEAEEGYGPPCSVRAVSLLGAGNGGGPSRGLRGTGRGLWKDYWGMAGGRQEGSGGATGGLAGGQPHRRPPQGPLMDPTEAACQGLLPNYQIVPRSPSQIPSRGLTSSQPEPVRKRQAQPRGDPGRQSVGRGPVPGWTPPPSPLPNTDTRLPLLSASALALASSQD